MKRKLPNSYTSTKGLFLFVSLFLVFENSYVKFGSAKMGSNKSHQRQSTNFKQ